MDIRQKFRELVLEESQIDLLSRLVSASRVEVDGHRQSFYFWEYMGGTKLSHPGLSGNLRARKHDIMTLGQAGLLSVQPTSQSGLRIDVNPEGSLFLDWLASGESDPIKRVGDDIRRFIDAPAFAGAYPKAYASWRVAEGMLWQSNAIENLTAIGHHCREALQEFADALVKVHGISGATQDKSKDISRIADVLGGTTAARGKSAIASAKALLGYWVSISELAQRQEHGGQKEGEPLTWEDGRRLVFTSLFVMHEVSRMVDGA